MANSGQIAQATPLEIGVTVQGSKSVEGSDQRELFSETTKTILVSENGAVLKLSTKVVAGQCVFLRNDQSGREILCRVVESRQAGEAGYTDLEFTVTEPKFWDVPAEPPVAPAQTAEAQKETPAPLVSSDALPIMDSTAPAPASGEVSAAFSEAAPSLAAPETAEGSEAEPKPSNTAQEGEAKAAKDAKDEVPDWDEEKDAQLMAVLAAMDGKSKPKREAAPKQTRAPGPDAATSTAKQEQTTPETASDAKLPATISSAIGRMRALGASQNPIYVGVGAVVLIAVVWGASWGFRRSSTRTNPALSAFSAQPAAQTQPAATPPSQTPASPSVAAPAADNATPGPRPSVQKVQRAAEEQKPSVVVVQTPDASTETGPTVVEHIEPPKREESSSGETRAAKIVSANQPAIPGWATGLDVDPVVRLDAVIDENGNLVETKPISGPRVLQASAQRAVALWVFEPALSDGKPTTAHLTLTVQFQKTPEGTN